MKIDLRTAVLHSVYSLVAFPFAIIGFVLTVTLFSSGTGLLVTVVGLPILTLMFAIARGLSYGDRAQLQSLMQLRPPAPRYKQPRPGSGWFARAFTPLSDPQSWLDAAFQIIRLPLGIFSFVVTVVWWSVTLAGLTYWLWGWSIPDDDAYNSVPEILGIGGGYFFDSIWWFIVGIVFALTMRWAMLVAAWAHAGPALLMLCGRAAMQEEVHAAHADREAAVASRDATRTAEHGALRRLERDIHDGPQQQLVRLSMDLGRVRRQMDTDPERARTILDEAITRSGSTLDELRALSRGIAPPLLVDRGLRAALEEIVTRAPVPVYLEFELDEELPEHLETGAYFVVSECLTNIAKHSGATFGAVRLEIEPTVTGRELVVQVTDDGIGGAHRSKGSGLAGLDDRVRSLEGVLEVHSPTGGPTLIEARMPCG
ncbi:MAG: sensor histidine kinase [Cumulibacter sp.]